MIFQTYTMRCPPRVQPPSTTRQTNTNYRAKVAASLHMMLARFRRMKPREPRECIKHTFVSLNTNFHLCRDDNCHDFHASSLPSQGSNSTENSSPNKTSSTPLQPNLLGRRRLAETPDYIEGQQHDRTQRSPSLRNLSSTKKLACMDGVLSRSNCPYTCGIHEPKTLAQQEQLYEPLRIEGIFRFIMLNPSEDIEQPLTCSLFHHELSPAFNYTALSYEWGTPKLSRKAGLRATEFIPLEARRHSAHKYITVNGVTMGVTQNLFDALLHVRSSLATGDGSVLWVDALCINQQDVAERGHQVAQMGIIYSHAQQVICWLGLATKDTYSIPYYAYADVIQRSYWYRLWIVQEFVLARRVVLLCGERSFSIDEIRDSGYVYKRFRELCALRQCYITARGKSTLPFGEALYYTVQSITTDPRDIIYGLLGLVDGESLRGLKPNYILSPCEVFCNAIQLLLHAIEEGSENEARHIKHYSTFSRDDDPYVGERRICNGTKNCSTFSWIRTRGLYNVQTHNQKNKHMTSDSNNHPISGKTTKADAI